MGLDVATLSMAAQAAGTVMSAVGAYNTGKANAAAARYQAGVARNNQIIAEQNAKFAEDKGNVEEQAQRQKTAQMIGAERALAGGAGVDVNTGSPLRLQSDTAMMGEMDALTIRNNAARAAWGYRAQGADFGAQAGMFGAQAENATRAGNLAAFSSIVGGASSVADKWAKKFKTQQNNPNYWGD